MAEDEDSEKQEETPIMEPQKRQAAVDSAIEKFKAAKAIAAAGRKLAAAAVSQAEAERLVREEQARKALAYELSQPSMRDVHRGRKLKLKLDRDVRIQARRKRQERNRKARALSVIKPGHESLSKRPNRHLARNLKKEVVSAQFAKA